MRMIVIHEPERIRKRIPPAISKLLA